MKKQLLFLALATSFIGIGANGNAEGKKSRQAFKIDIFKGCHPTTRDDVTSTDKINGVDIWKMLHSFEKMDPHGVVVRRQLNANTFSQSRELDTFDQNKLDRAYFEGILLSEADSKKWDQDDLELATQLHDRACVLCIQSDLQTIVMKAMGNPETVCEKLKDFREAASEAASFKARVLKSAMTSCRVREIEAAKNKKRAAQ